MEQNETGTGENLKLKKTEERKKLPMVSTAMTPESIIGKLFSFHNRAHYLHLNADTIGKHLLLDELYKALVDFKDEIAEYLLGIQAPKRLGVIIMDPIETFSDTAMMKLLVEGFEFSVSLCDYAEERELEELCNMASDLQKAFVKAKLFTTYK